MTAAAPRFAALALFVATSFSLASDPHAAPAGGPTPDEALRQIKEGNERYTADQRKLPNQDEARRCLTVSGGQHPVAAVLSCADSRAPVEILFDQGIGDLFVIRVAGNVAATDEIGTLEYGVEHLNIPLIVVLGHTKCGAVTAVVDGAHVEGNLAKLVQPIVPAANRAKDEHPTLSGAKLVSAAITANVEQAISDLTNKSPVIDKAVRAGKVKIVGGVYDLHGGGIRWLEEEDAPVAAGPKRAADPHASDAHFADPLEAAPAKPVSTKRAPKPADDDPHAAPSKPAKTAAHDDDHADPHGAKPAKAAAHGDDDASPAHPPTKKSAASKAADPHAKDSGHAAEDHDEHADAGKESAKKDEPVKSDAPHNWYVLGGMLGASTLLGAVVTRLIPRKAAHA